MSKPRGKCAFCAKAGNLTKSHIWPDWAAAILPQTATHHEQIIGEFSTFVPKSKGPTLSKRIRHGHVGTRKPRNTCRKCNGEWMREIEEATMPFLGSLLLGNPYLLGGDEQQKLASFLCLVSMRIESASQIKTVPQSDRDWLRTNRTPPANWNIWIARHEGGDQRMDQRHTPMQIASSPDVTIGPEHCNTQVTSLVIGKLYAHLFSSTTWKNFRGYNGIDLYAIWPADAASVEVSTLSMVLTEDVPWLHETIPRTLRHIPS